MTELQRLVLNFRSGELVVRCFYRSEGEAGPNTKVRRRQVQDLTREGLSAALEALEGQACGCRRDVGVHYPGSNHLMYNPKGRNPR